MDRERLVKANRRDFMALMGGLALAIPHLELPTPLPELVMDGFDDGDEYVWINGQPLRGVKRISISDQLLFLPRDWQVRPDLYVTILSLYGQADGQAYQDFYNLLAAHYYKSVDVIYYEARWATNESNDRFRSRLTRQTMTVLDLDDESYFKRGTGISMRLTSKEPFDQWTWWSDEVPPPGYKSLSHWPDNLPDVEYRLLHPRVKAKVG